MNIKEMNINKLFNCAILTMCDVEIYNKKDKQSIKNAKKIKKEILKNLTNNK